MTPATFTAAWYLDQRAKRAPKIETAVSVLAHAPARRGKASALELKFQRLWQSVGGPPLVPEFKFHNRRKWRADFAHTSSRTLIEIEGGAWNGRHTRGAGFLKDSEKYLAAYLAGWSVVRLTAPQLTFDTVLAVAARVGINTKL